MPAVRYTHLSGLLLKIFLAETTPSETTPSETTPSESSTGADNQGAGAPIDDGNDDDKTGLIVGLVIACVVVVAGCAAALIYFFVCKDKRTAFTPGEPDIEDAYSFNMDATK